MSEVEPAQGKNKVLKELKHLTIDGIDEKGKGQERERTIRISKRIRVKTAEQNLDFHTCHLLARVKVGPPPSKD